MMNSIVWNAFVSYEKVCEIQWIVGINMEFEELFHNSCVNEKNFCNEKIFFGRKQTYWSWLISQYLKKDD